MSKEPISVLENRVLSLWPHFKNNKAILNNDQLSQYIQFTYGYGPETERFYSRLHEETKSQLDKRAQDAASQRLAEYADSDEAKRETFIMRLALEYSFDGSNPRVCPHLYQLWRDLHCFVICPLHWKTQTENLYSSTISWLVKRYELDEGKVREIWNNIYDNNTSSPDDNWLNVNFASWLLLDIERMNISESSDSKLLITPKNEPTISTNEVAVATSSTKINNATSEVKPVKSAAIKSNPPASATSAVKSNSSASVTSAVKSKPPVSATSAVKLNPPAPAASTVKSTKFSNISAKKADEKPKIINKPEKKKVVVSDNSEDDKSEEDKSDEDMSDEEPNESDESDDDKKAGSEADN